MAHQPASTKYHLNREGGLLEHSIGVAETLLQLRAALAPEISEESCVIVGLFPNIGKVRMSGKPYYLQYIPISIVSDEVHTHMPEVRVPNANSLVFPMKI